MKRVGIGYASRYGQTEKIARFIAEQVQAMGHEVTLVDLRAGRGSRHFKEFKEALESCDAVILGAGVYAGGYPRELKRFIRRNEGLLREKPSAFYSVSLSPASNTEKGWGDSYIAVRELLRGCDWRPDHLASFGGKLSYLEYSFFIRRVMRRIVGKAGGPRDMSRDYEYTDWDSVKRFTEEIVNGESAGEFSGTRIELPPKPAAA